MSLARALTTKTRIDGDTETFVIPVGGGTMAHSLSSAGADASEDGTGRGTPVIAIPIQDAGRPANTLHEKGLSVIGVGVRRLTPLECERLQGFPDGWTEGQSDAARYRQLGNAVAVPVFEWVGRRIVAEELSQASPVAA